MFDDGIVKKKRCGFDPETSIYCFGGGGGGGGGSTSPDPTREVGQNTRVDSRGNRVNFNTRSTVQAPEGPNYTKTLPNGVEVVDFSTPFQGQVNLSNQAMPSAQPTVGGMFGNMPDPAATGVKNPSVLSPVTGTTPFNPDNFVGQAPLGMDTSLGAFGQQVNEFQQANIPTTPAQALQNALSTGRVQLGGGFYAGRTPSGFGLGVERVFAKGGAVESQGIASLMRKK